MGTVSTIILFVVMTVMALAVIVLAIWAAKLSSQLKQLSDVIFSGDGAMGAAGAAGSRDGAGLAAGGRRQPYQQPSMVASSPQAQASPRFGYAQQARGSEWQQPGSMGVTGAGMRPVGQSGMQRGAGQAGAQWRGQATASAASSGPQGGGFNGVPDGEMDFFERYKQHEDPNSTGAFGRQKPSIPFGEDRTAPSRRDSYAESAADFDIEPDSIDFSRVAGYRNVINR